MSAASIPATDPPPPADSSIEARDAAPAPGAGGVAVVELFTSQGCSSCPPADDLLGEIARDARERGRPVFALAFHIDYWDDLGWPDRFADRAYTARQRGYRRAFVSRRIYTPQMVVNGRTEFVGSDGRQAAREIESALNAAATTTPVELSVEHDTRDGAGAHTLAVTYEVQRPPDRAVLNVAVVERGLEDDVTRGENAGRTLRHDNVVRAFRAVPLGGGGRGRVELDVPADVVVDHGSVIAYVQEDAGMRIVGAAAVDIPAEPTGSARM